MPLLFLCDILKARQKRGEKKVQKLYQKSQILFSVAFIIAYVVGASFFDGLSSAIKAPHLITILFLAILTALLLFFLRNNRLFEHYGLCKAKITAKKMLFYLPFLLFACMNLVFGVAINFSPLQTALFIVKMAFVAFLEELIFRGLLFKAMAEGGIKSAVLVSSITFGIGHIVNLFNGSGMTLVSNLFQIVTAVAIGFVFTLVVIKTKSIWAVFAAHFIVNAASAFSADISLYQHIIVAVIIILVSALYCLYIIKFVK